MSLFSTSLFDIDHISITDSPSTLSSNVYCFSIDSENCNEDRIDPVDFEFRNVVTEAISNVESLSTKTNRTSHIVIGGSTVEGAAVTRFFQPKEDGGVESKNKEVEVDLNLVVCLQYTELHLLYKELH